MNFTLEEVKYLQEVLNCASSYTIARGEQISNSTVSHKEIKQKLDDYYHRLTS
tara:strand:+ start:41966 stop:42124 length:159 start_codon:yes stop_codon:yes gene_type:complete